MRIKYTYNIFLQHLCLNENTVCLKLSRNPSTKLIFQVCIKALGISFENFLTWITSVLVYVQKCVTAKVSTAHQVLDTFVHWRQSPPLAGTTWQPPRPLPLTDV